MNLIGELLDWQVTSPVLINCCYAEYPSTTLRTNSALSIVEAQAHKASY